MTSETPLKNKEAARGSQKWPNPCKYHAKRARCKSIKMRPKTTKAVQERGPKAHKMAPQKMILGCRAHQRVSNAPLSSVGSFRELILCGIYMVFSIAAKSYENLVSSKINHQESHLSRTARKHRAYHAKWPIQKFGRVFQRV